MTQTNNHLILVTRQSDGNLTVQPVPPTLKADAGQGYALIDRTSKQAPDTLVLKRRDDDLVAEVDSTQVLVIEDYFVTDGMAFLPQASYTGSEITGNAVITSTSTEALSDGSDTVIWPSTESSSGLSISPVVWGGALLGGLALALTSDDDDHATSTPPVPEPEPTANSIVNGNVVAGPVTADNGLTVDIFAADGETLLGSAKVNAEGTFSADVSDYTGIIIAKVRDADDGPDYWDEATGEPKDLISDLSTIAVITQPETMVSVNINPLTTLAAALAQNTGEGELNTEALQQAQQSLAELFGLPNLNGLVPEPVNGSNFNADDGLNDSEAYGVVLAALSGLDDLNGGNTQASLTEILNGLSRDDSGKLILSKEIQARLIEGARRTQDNTDIILVDSFANVIDTQSPIFSSPSEASSLDENSGAEQVVHTVNATDATDVTYRIKPDTGDGELFSIDVNTGQLTLTDNPDHESQTSYQLTIIATDSAGNSSEQTLTLSVNDLDETAPSFTSATTAPNIEENSGANQVIYTASTTDTADVDDNTDTSAEVTYQLKDVDDFSQLSIDANTGEVTLINNPDFDAQNSYSFTVIATDTAGNSTEQAVSLNIDEGADVIPPPPPPAPDTTAPVFSSGASANIAENAGTGNVVYTASATDNNSNVTYSLAAGSNAALSINASTGAVILSDNPDHEAKASYDFTVVATDAAGNNSERAVTLTVTDTDESAPTITSGTTATAIDENSGAGQVVYTTTATDTADVDDATDTTGQLTYSLQAGGDAGLSIDSNTGAVTLTGSPDHENQASYSFTVVATDTAGNSSEQAVTLNVNDLDDSTPTITSSATATAIDENTGAAQVVYTATATDTSDVDNATDTSGDLTYSLKAVNDHALFTINATTGAVTLTGNPDHEAQASYNFTAVATDAASNSSEQAVTLNVNDLDESAPSITSGASATAIDENAGIARVVYTTTATDTADVDDATDTSSDLTYSLKAVDDHTFFTINSATGEVTLTGDPDHETQANYSFTVVATDAAGNSTEQAVTLNVNDLDESAPTITSGATATAIDENTGASQVVYTATATDSADVDDATDTSSELTYSLKDVDDHALFTINATTGAVTLTGSPDHENQASYSFTVIATDTAGNSIEQAVTLDINDLDESAPTITSDATATAIDENIGAAQVVYTATATDTADVDDVNDTSSDLTYSLKGVDDHALFTINATTGAVTLTGNPDHETQVSYNFTVVATDAASNSSEQAVTLNVNDLDESAPSITSGASATAIDENAGITQVVYTTTATDTADVDDATDTSSDLTYSLKAVDDHTFFTINSATGEVTLTGNPDHENQASYSFTVVATDAEGNNTEQAVTLNVNDLDESAPAITSGATAIAIDENTGAGQVVYVAAATDTADVDDATDTSSDLTYSLKGVDDHALFTINATTGAVTLTGSPDYENQASYSFTVVATDAAGNNTEQAVTLGVNDLDESAPTITSGATATDINENSGAGQVVYTAIATDTADVDDATDTSVDITYSIKAVDDHALLSINGGTGEVTLTANPDYETKPSYNFTVIATDTAGNSTEQAVSFDINDLADEIAPSVSSIAITSATGRQNNTLNADDVITVIATMDEATIVDTTSGTPRLALNIGGSTVYATYAGGSGTTALTFTYTVQAGDTDANGISIDANAIDANGGTLRDAAGNSADLTHSAVADNASYLVDTTAPSVTSVAGSVIIANTDNLTVQSSELGNAYLVSTAVTVNSVSDINGALDAQWNSVAIGTANSDTSLAATGLSDGTYTLYSEDQAGNLSSVPFISTIILDSTDPVLYSGAIATAVDENSGAGQAIYDANAADDTPLTYTLKAVDDHASFTINSSTGVVTLTGDPNYETQNSYDFTVVATDAAGNSAEQAVTLGINDVVEMDTSVVVFDLVNGQSSSHSGRTFSAAESYTIYIQVDSDSSTLSSSFFQWTGGNNLGADDRIILVGNGSNILGGPMNMPVTNDYSGFTYYGLTTYALTIQNFGDVYRYTSITTNTVDLWTGTWASNPNNNNNFSTLYLTDLPSGVRTSQGLV